MERRIESNTSRTAEFTCLVRAMSYLEDRPQYKSNDWVAGVVMNSLIKQLIRWRWIRRHFEGPAGMYEYVICRTKVIDECVLLAARKNITQIVILGAGFDSRGIRFADQVGGARFFEMDVPVTQNAKIARYREMKIHSPEDLIYIPIDFDHESIPDKLSTHGFEKDVRSLFILEGLTMYLQPQSIAELFSTISDLAGEGSEIVFDFIHASVVRGENRYTGERELVNSVSGQSERFCFGIEKGGLPQFLAGFDFDLVEVLAAEDLRDRFFRDDSGKPVAEVNGTHCIALGVKREKLEIPQPGADG
jgi:methyltransferase (TIGR00027 family)